MLAGPAPEPVLRRLVLREAGCMLGELELAIVDFCANLTCWPFAGRTHFQNFCRLAPSFVGSVGINPEGDPSKPIAAAFSQVRR